MKDNTILVYKCMLDYDKKTSLEIQEELAPIIKRFNKRFLENYIGVSSSHLLRICKSLYVRNNEKPNFETYIRIKMLEKNFSMIEPKPYKKYKTKNKGVLKNEKDNENNSDNRGNKKDNN